MTMDREEIHRDILKRLLSLRGDVVSKVRLVSRLYNDELLGGTSTASTYFFIPDLHLVSREADDTYRFTYHRLESTRFINRSVLLDRVCSVMLDFWNSLPPGRSLKTVQLGDFVDLWRENEYAQDDVTGLVARILDDYPEARKRLVRRGDQSLEPEIILGNHDMKMSASTELKRARRALPCRLGGQTPLLVTHGDLFDDLETVVENELQEWFVEHFGPVVPPTVYRLDRTTDRTNGQIGGSEGSAPLVIEHADQSVGLPDWVNVWVTVSPCEEETLKRSHKLLPRALEYAAGLRKGKQKYLKKMELSDAFPALRTMVIGHSHFARICVHRDAKKSENDLVLVDAGAWIEYARFGSEKVPSCQIGILCGGDMRIYQLDPHESLYQEG